MATTFSTVASFTDATEGTVRQYTTSDTTAGDHVHIVRQTIGTSEEEITIHADITGGSGPGWIIVKNHDATNFVSFGTVTTVYWAKLDPDDGTETLMVPLMNTIGSVFLKADTAGCDVTIEIRER